MELSCVSIGIVCCIRLKMDDGEIEPFYKINDGWHAGDNAMGVNKETRIYLDSIYNEQLKLFLESQLHELEL